VDEAGIIQAFLADPKNKGALASFITICHIRALAYLKYLKALGFILPESGFSNKPLFRTSPSTCLANFWQVSAENRFILYSIILPVRN
jgi:hypothetical protein